jgi:hypothetical protein
MSCLYKPDKPGSTYMVLQDEQGTYRCPHCSFAIELVRTCKTCSRFYCLPCLWLCDDYDYNICFDCLDDSEWMNQDPRSQLRSNGRYA